MSEKTLETSLIQKDIEYEFVRLLLRDEVFCATYIEHLTPNIFKESLRPIVSSCIDYWQQYGKLITNEALVQSIQFKIGVGLDTEKIKNILTVLTEINKDITISEYAQDILQEFIVAQKIENSLISSVQLYKKYLKHREFHIIETIPDIVSEAAQPIILSEPVRIVAGLDERTKTREKIVSGELLQSFVPTNIAFLDNALRSNGLEPGQIALWTAATGAGKTIALIHNCYAANLNGKNAVFFTLEMDADTLCERTDSMISREPFGTTK